MHQQIGFGAEQFLTPEAKSIIHNILEPKYNGSIGRAGAWADDYAHTHEGAFSYQWHWIDSADQPPAYCNVYYHRDCAKGGCIVSAIADQTQILKFCIARAKAGTLIDGSDLRCSYALKWITHFLGDIAQPLHASGVAAGGNKFPVVFGNHSTELHAVSLVMVLFLCMAITETFLRSGTVGLSMPMQRLMPFRTQPCNHSLASLSSAFDEMTLISQHLNGLRAAILPRLSSALSAGPVTATRGHVTMSTPEYTMEPICPPVVMQTTLSPLSNYKSARPC